MLPKCSDANRSSWGCPMSEPLSICIHYDVVRSVHSVQRVLDAVSTTVNRIRVEMIAAERYLFPYETAEFPSKSAEELLRKLNEPKPLFPDGLAYSEVVAAPFSPVSAYALEVQFWRHQKNETLEVHLSASERITYEREGSREREQMEWEWMKKMETHGLVSLDSYWSFEPPTENEMPRKEYDRWRKRYDELDETPCVWPQNREHLLTLVESLKQVLPVTSVNLDERLLPAAPRE
jgi:hypothetical protein